MRKRRIALTLAILATIAGAVAFAQTGEGEETPAAQPSKEAAPGAGPAPERRRTEPPPASAPKAPTAAEPAAAPAEPATEGAPAPAEPAADKANPEPAKKDEEAPPPLEDAQLKQQFASVKSDKARMTLETGAAIALADPAKNFIEELRSRNAALLAEVVSTVAASKDPEGAATTMTGVLGIKLEKDGDYDAMVLVAQNAITSTAKGILYIPPPGAPRDAIEHTFWMPPRKTVTAEKVDFMFDVILYLSLVCFIGITIATVWFTIKYRHRPGHKAQPSSHHNDTLEITWTVIPSLIVVVIFIVGWRGFVDMMTPPRHALEVEVIGQKWNWTFKYPNGWTDNVLHVPVKTPVRLIMRSEDVLHDFALPVFRIKQDVVPRRYTKLWFEAEEPGVYRANCAEYCGQQHSDMKTWIQIHPEGGYEKYLEKAEEQLKTLPPAEIGQMMYRKNGCAQCHTVDGSAGTGPTFRGNFGLTRTFTDGSKRVVDEDYIRQSILEPQSQVIAGFQPVMPTFKGKLKDWQIDGIIAYMKSLKQ